jgi:hypothetical protein
MNFDIRNDYNFLSTFAEIKLLDKKNAQNNSSEVKNSSRVKKPIISTYVDTEFS